ncbi:MAG: Gfo/Idh/MocA family oxidoreductase [Planctomycetota bacterium]
MRVGIAGIGFMGWIHYLAYQACQDAELVGFCSRDPSKREGDWTRIKGNFGPPGGTIDTSGLHVHETLDDLIADDAIDWIDLCLPPHLHAAAIDQCLASGKRVLCEKPLALDAKTGDRLCVSQASGDGKPRLLVAHILPFMNEYQFLYQACLDRRFGSIRSARLKRFISPPDWIPDFYDPVRVGGPLIDLHVHDAHLVRLLFGMPERIHTAVQWTEAIGGGQIPKRYETLMEFGDGRHVSSGGGVIDAPGRAFTHGYEVHFENATLQFEFAAYTDGQTASIPLIVVTKDGKIERPELGDPDPVQAFVRQMQAAAESAATGKLHPALDPNIATDAIRICEQIARSKI